MTHLWGLDALSLTDRASLDVLCRGPTVSRPFHVVHHAFEHFVDSIPDNPAVVHIGRTTTYAELDKAANVLANTLIKRGIQPREKVCIVIKRSIEMVIAILAVLKCGCQYVPLDGGVVPADTLLSIVNEVDARFILCQEQFDSICMASAGPSTVTLIIEHNTQAKLGLVERPVRHVSPDDGAYVVYTSGIAGQLKGVDVTHGNVTNLMLLSPGNLGIEPGTKVAQLLSVSFDLAAWEILGTLMNGGTLHIRGPSWREVAYVADVAITTPSVLNLVDPSRCPNLKVIAVAGEPCPKTLADKWSSHVTLYNCCGSVEATIVNTMNKQRPGDDITTGKPIPNTNVYILNEHEEPLPVGAVGLIYAGGLCVSKGYVEMSEATAKRFRPDKFTRDGKSMFNTGYLGRWRDDGKLERLGQIDKQVKINGSVVDLEEVSLVVERYPGVTSACTILHDDTLWVFFEAEPAPNAALIRTFIGTELPDYPVPLKVVHTSLPRDQDGLIDKRKLADIAYSFSTAQNADQSFERGEVLINTAKLQSFSTAQARLASNHSAEEFPYRMPPRGRGCGEGFLRYCYSSLYRPHFIILLLGNILAILLVAIRSQGPEYRVLSDLINATAVNLTLSILARQEYVLNLIFCIFCSISLSAPLFIRRNCAKIHEIGAIHSGGAVAAAVWFLVFTIVETSYAYSETSLSPLLLSPMPVIIPSYILLALLGGMAVFAHFRTRSLNRHALTHSLFGWSVLVAFWIELVFFTGSVAISYQQTLGVGLIQSASFWLLIVSTLSVLVPLVHLRRVSVRSEGLSAHSIRLHLSHRVRTASTAVSKAVQVSERPLVEWRTFSIISPTGDDSFSIIVSDLGDRWSAQAIKRPPTRLYMRVVPACRMLRIIPLFHSIVLVATGSGITSCLPILLAKKIPVRVYWSVEGNAEEIFGKEVVDMVKDADPAALICDTRRDSGGSRSGIELQRQEEQGRGRKSGNSTGRISGSGRSSGSSSSNSGYRKYDADSIVPVTWKLFRESGAEAVCVVSDRQLTNDVVYAMEARCIPAYGAVEEW